MLNTRMGSRKQEQKSFDVALSCGTEVRQEDNIRLCCHDASTQGKYPESSLVRNKRLVVTAFDYMERSHAYLAVGQRICESRLVSLVSLDVKGTRWATAPEKSIIWP